MGGMTESVASLAIIKLLREQEHAMMEQRRTMLEQQKAQLGFMRSFVDQQKQTNLSSDESGDYKKVGQ